VVLTGINWIEGEKQDKDCPSKPEPDDHACDHCRPPRQQRAGLRAIVGLAAGQNEIQGIAMAVADQVDFGA
jgi:hypothetical protein